MLTKFIVFVGSCYCGVWVLQTFVHSEKIKAFTRKTDGRTEIPALVSGLSEFREEKNQSENTERILN